MDWQSLFAALALVLVIEGVIPFVSPGRYRRLVQSIAGVSDRHLRLVGIISMAVGVLLLTIVKA